MGRGGKIGLSCDPGAVQPWYAHIKHRMLRKSENEKNSNSKNISEQSSRFP